MITLALKRNQLWFCVNGVVLVRTYPQAVKLLEET